MHNMAPHGRSGGILLGVDLGVFDIGAIGEGDIYVKFLLRNKSDGFKFNLYTVYGPAQQQNKEVFLTELARICSHETLPYIIGGDFNIMSMNLFNAVIQAFDLKEIYMSGHLYTWAGPGDDPTY